jgi:hypothetical protein
MRIFNFADGPDCAKVSLALSPAIPLKEGTRPMTTPSVGVERRIGQRFAYNLPVSLRNISTSTEGLGFTHDLSSRGVFFFTSMALSEGAEVELTLQMPSEITLGDNMRVRCRGQVLRIRSAELKAGPADSNEPTSQKIGVAVCFSTYEYLADPPDGSSDFRRVSALHHPIDEQDPAPVTLSPRIDH